MTGPMFPETCEGCGEKMTRPFVALSRFDNERNVCSMCGSAEAVAVMVLGISHPAIQMMIIGRQENCWEAWCMGLKEISTAPDWIEYNAKIQESFKRLKEMEGAE